MYFSPVNVAKAVMNESECVSRPCITLREVDKVYKEGTAQSIIRNLISGLYSMSLTKEKMPYEAANNAAALFVAKYGHQCTLYGVMLYFGNYSTEYKSSFAQFDVQDVLQQFSKKFLPWWHSRQTREENSKATIKSEDTKPRGKEALKIYIKKILSEGGDIRAGGLYRMGQIKEALIAECEKEIQDGVF